MDNWSDTSRLFSLSAAIFLSLTMTGSVTVRVFQFQEDVWQAPNIRTFARYNFSQEPLKTITNFTICYRLKLAAIVQGNVHLSYANPSFPNNALLLEDSRLKLEVIYNDAYKYNTYTVEPILHKWQHYCHTYDKQDIRSYHNGLLVASHEIESTTKTGLNLDGILIFGQDQDSLAGSFDVNEILRGSLTQVEIFDNVLADSEIYELLHCGQVPYKPIFSSDVAQLELFGVKTVDVSIESLCDKTETFLMLTNITTFDETIKICSRTGGEPFIPTTTDKNNKVHSVLTQPSSVCKPNHLILFGIRRNVISEHWSSYDGRRNIDIVFLQKNAASVTFDKKDCALMGISSPLWYLDDCSSKQRLSCTPCSYGNFPSLRLRGLCFKQEEFGFTYILGYHSKTPYFYSLSGILIYKVNNNEWYMLDATKQKIIASTRLITDTYYPLGRKLWTVQVHGLCQFRQHDNVLITLTSCESSMFTCDSGDCIATNDLCDGIAQCQDQSDESNCTILHVPQTYNYRSPPQNEAPLIIIFNIEILQVLEIDDDHHWLQLDLVVTLTWKDGRLKFMNLHQGSDNNFLNDDEVAQIWTPKFQFSPVQDGDSTLIDKQVQIVAAGKALSTDYNRHREDSIYPGVSGEVVLSQYFSIKFVCHFEVFRYPFDRHQCPFSLTLDDMWEEVQLLRMNSVINVTLEEPSSSFVVQNISQFVTTQDGASSVQVVMQLSRLAGVPLVTVMLPSCQLVAVVYSTLFVRSSLLQVRLPVSLSALLVLVTLFRQAVYDLPRTPYIKIMDAWFLSVTVIVCAVILAHIASEYADMKHEAKISSSSSENKTLSRRMAKCKAIEEKPSQEWMKMIRLYVFPSATAGCLAFLWFFGFYK